MSSPEAMEHLTRQQDFDTVAVKLVRQGRPAMRPTVAQPQPDFSLKIVCTYCAPNGDRCAAGHLLDMPDDKAAALPNVSASQSPVCDIFRNDGHDVSFVVRLQSAHDVPARLYGMDHAAWLAAWARKMREIVIEYRLSPATLDEALRGHGHVV